MGVHLHGTGDVAGEEGLDCGVVGLVVLVVAVNALPCLHCSQRLQAVHLPDAAHKKSSLSENVSQTADMSNMILFENQ